VAGNMSQMIGRLLGEDITMQIHFSGEPALVDADPSMLEQILLNLSVNSRDAMPHGGQLTIRISHCDISEQDAGRNVDAKPGRYVCLSHADSGTGIPPENLNRIFEPFFTTKELGKGTGLGLATVFGIVKQHHGWIQVESELGKGMIPKVDSAVAAIKSGVEKVSFVDGRMNHSVLIEIFTDKGVGTEVVL